MEPFWGRTLKIIRSGTNYESKPSLHSLEHTHTHTKSVHSPNTKIKKSVVPWDQHQIERGTCF